jgi:AraC-like DNA-binding protein
MDSVLSVATAAGFSDVVLMDAGEVETLVRAHLRDDSKRGAYAAAIRCVGRAMPRQHHALACDAIHEASACTSVELLGNRVGSSRWKLDRKLGPIGITASDFVDCCRLVLGGALLEHTDWPVHRVAAEVGYDVRAFRDKTKEIIGCLPSELKGAGATERTGRAVAAKFGICAAHPRIAKERDLPWRRRSH